MEIAAPLEQLASALGEYRRERAENPHFYYNELAERTRAAASLRPALENFTGEFSSLSEFKAAVSKASRTQRSVARGRTGSRYWRFNSAGLLFLETLYNRASEHGLLNALSRLLQKTLVAPGGLEEAERRIEQLLEFWNALPGEEHPIPQSGLIPYLLSYFWALQNMEWPVYNRDTREMLEKIGMWQAEKNVARNPATAYGRFYLAFNRLAGILQIKGWELESFLLWEARRNAPELKRVLSYLDRPAASPAAKRRRLEDLRAELERRLRREVASNLRGLSDATPRYRRLSFRELNLPLRLEVHLAKPLRAGIAFDGFSPALLAGIAGIRLLEELAGFLAERRNYRFYPAVSDVPLPLSLEELGGEFYLLQEFESDSLVEKLVSEWRTLYPFARELINFMEAPAAELDVVNEPEEIFAYPAVAEDGLRSVAEKNAAYGENVAEQAAEEVYPLPPPNSFYNSEFEQRASEELQNLLLLSPEPLLPDQLEAVLAYIEERLVVHSSTIHEIVTHLQAGRNVLLYGPPGCGKTRLARLIAGQLCAPDPGWTPEQEAANYTLATATAEWSQYEVIGGIRPGLQTELEQMAATPPEMEESRPERLTYYFEPGVVSRAVLECELSLRTTGRPHYLIIDEFNRANQDRAFGELFTLLEYRDRPLLPARHMGRAVPLYIPGAFRIIGTMNSEDRNTLFEMGMALRRRFALVEIGLPDPVAERRFMPRAVHTRLPEVSLDSIGEFSDPSLRYAADRLALLAQAIRPDAHDPQGEGKKIGTAPLIECLVYCAVASRYFRDPNEAFQDALQANLLPQLDRSPAGVARALKLFEENKTFNELNRARESLRRMFRMNARYF